MIKFKNLFFGVPVTLNHPLLKNDPFITWEDSLYIETRHKLLYQWDPGKHIIYIYASLQWRHNERNGVSDLQPHDCLFNRLFRRRSKQISKLRVTGLCAGNSPMTGEFPAQKASNAENVAIWWHHHSCMCVICCVTLYLNIISLNWQPYWLWLIE